MHQQNTSLPAYVVMQKAFINNHLYEPGEVVYTDLPPGTHMRPAIINGAEDQEARRRVDAMLASDPKGPLHPDYYGNMVAYYGSGEGIPKGRINAVATPPQPQVINLAGVAVPKAEHDAVVTERDAVVLREQAAAQAHATEMEEMREKLRQAEAERDQLLSAPSKDEKHHKGR